MPTIKLLNGQSVYYPDQKDYADAAKSRQEQVALNGLILNLAKFSRGSSIEPMSDEVTELFVGMMMHELDRERAGEQPTPFTEKDLEKYGGPAAFPMKVYAAHAKETRAMFVTIEVLTLFAVLANGRPHIMTMWAHSVAQEFGLTDTGQPRMVERISAEKPLTVGTLVRIFPNGFPTEEAYSTAWDYQKRSDNFGGNHIDDRANWPKLGDASGEATAAAVSKETL